MNDLEKLLRQYEDMSFNELVRVRDNAVLSSDVRKVLEKVLKAKEADRLFGKGLEERAKELFEASPLVKELRQFAQEEAQRVEDEKRENWFYTLDGQSQEGPVSLNMIRNLIQSGKIHKNTLVWYPGLGEWSKAYSVELLFPKQKAPPPTKETPPSIPGKIVGTGTGWFVAPGVVVTNYHVIESVRNFSVALRNGVEIPVQPISIDRVNGIAILRATKEIESPKYLPLSSKTEKQGARVFTLGFPHADVLGQKSKLTDGLVSSITGLEDDHRFYQISVPLQAGNSGGPLINLRGGVVGIVTAKLSAVTIYNATGDLPENVNYAVKTAYLKILLDSEDIQYEEENEKESIPIEMLSELYSKSIAMVLVRN